MWKCYISLDVGLLVIFFKFFITSIFFLMENISLRIQYYKIWTSLKDIISILIAELLIESPNNWLLQYETSSACLGNFCLNMLNVLFQSKVIVLPLSEIISATIFFSPLNCALSRCQKYPLVIYLCISNYGGSQSLLLIEIALRILNNSKIRPHPWYIN